MYFSYGSSPIITLVNIDYLKIHLDKRTSCMTLFSKIKIAGDRIDEIRWSKDQKLSTLNLLTLKTIYRFLQIRFPGPNRLFWRMCLQNLVFEISCVGEDLARFQKPLFWTPDITPHPSPALVFHVIFVEPKTSSREPWLEEFYLFANIMIECFFCNFLKSVFFLNFIFKSRGEQEEWVPSKWVIWNSCID
jgi:hypothetical protein